MKPENAKPENEKPEITRYQFLQLLAIFAIRQNIDQPLFDPAFQFIYGIENIPDFIDKRSPF